MAGHVPDVTDKNGSRILGQLVDILMRKKGSNDPSLDPFAAMDRTPLPKGPLRKTDSDTGTDAAPC